MRSMISVRCRKYMYICTISDSYREWMTKRERERESEVRKKVLATYNCSRAATTDHLLYWSVSKLLNWSAPQLISSSAPQPLIPSTTDLLNLSATQLLNHPTTFCFAIINDLGGFTSIKCSVISHVEVFLFFRFRFLVFSFDSGTLAASISYLLMGGSELFQPVFRHGCLLYPR